MEANQTQKTVFCCPHHGVLQETVEYTSAIIESKRLINIPVMRCPECNEYYTPFTNLLALGSLRYNGKQIRASKGRAEKSIPRIEVLRPSFVDIDCVAAQEAKDVKEQEKPEVRIMPDLTKLTKPEIEYLCRQMAPKEIRSYFQKFPKDFTRIRPGFRPTSLSDEDAINLIIRHSDKPFIWSYIENTVKIWLSEIESYIEDTVQKGSSPEEALLQAMPQSVFAENVELYLSLTDAKYSPEYVLLLKSATGLLGRLATAPHSSKSTGESEAKIEELTQKMTTLQETLDAERIAHLSDTQALAEATAQNAVLQQSLAAAEARIDAAATKSVQMQEELERLRKLAKYADSDAPDSMNPEFEYTSICQVYSDYYTGQTWLTRLADISAGKISRFARMDDNPPYFGNRDRLFWRDGPHEEGYIGIWHWNAVPNKADPSTDYVTTSFNKQGKIIEVVELPECRTYEEIVRYLGSNSIPYSQGRKYFFMLSGSKGNIPGLLCGDNDLDIANGMAKLKSSTYVLPQFIISATDLISIAGKNYYRHTNMGTPQDIYHVKSPFEVVKDIVITRATSAALRQQGISKKEAQHCQVFLRDLPVDTLAQEIANVYGCPEAEATEYVTNFIAFADAYLNETDLDIGTLAAALSRNPDMIVKCKHLLEAEWRAENDGMIQAAQEELDRISNEAATQSANAKELESRIAMLLSQIDDMEAQIASKIQLANDVEAKVAERIAAAQSNAADFICEMAFVSGRNNTPPTAVHAEGKTSVIRHSINCNASGSIDDLDLFEEELACNFNALGYNAAYANQMAQVVTFCICNHQPILCGSNGSAIADAISAMFHAKGAYEVTMPIASDRCSEICEAIGTECSEENAVILLNGVFDGYNLNAYSNVLQYSSSWENNCILIFSIAGIDPAAIPAAVLDNAWFIDGDLGLTQFPHGSLNGFETKRNMAVKFAEATFKTERKKMKPFSAVLSNRAILNYTGFLVASECELKKSDLLLIQLLIQGQAQGKTEEMISSLENSGIELSSNKALTRYL